MSPDECLSAAWTHCAPNRAKGSFPRGFWPDVARVAMEMFAQQTMNPKLSFRPTMASRGGAPEVKRPSKLLKKSNIDTSKLKISI